MQYLVSKTTVVIYANQCVGSSPYPHCCVWCLGFGVFGAGGLAVGDLHVGLWADCSDRAMRMEGAGSGARMEGFEAAGGGLLFTFSLFCRCLLPFESQVPPRSQIKSSATQ
jgi:hypothetical protein